MSKKSNGRTTRKTTKPPSANGGPVAAAPTKTPKLSNAAGPSGGAAVDAAASPIAEVTITAAKGRPMLTWVGKRPLRHVKAFPAQPVEKFAPLALGASERWKDWSAHYPQEGLLFHGDNKEVLAHLLANGFRGKVNLIYIDPPFDSGADYVRKVSLRGAKGTAKLDGEGYTLGEQIQYTDIWANDNYLQFMYERLLLLRELLAENGSLYMQSDWHRAHFLRLLLEEVFGADSFINQIVWKRGHAHSDSAQGSTHYGRLHEVVLYCSKGENRVFNQQYTPYDQEYIDTYYKYVEEGTGRRYWLDNLQGPGGGAKGNPYYEVMGVSRYWRYSKEKMERLIADGRVVQTNPGTVPKFKRYLDEMPGRPVQDVWDDIRSLAGMGARESERLDYPTQKPEELLDRIIKTSSSPGDLVLDAFIGSGTTAAVAQKLGRRWIGCDINNGAIQITAKRLRGVIAEQAAAQGGLGFEGERSMPTQASFSSWRVNDYDLQVQHNEAVNLAADYIGLQRMRADGYFDGTLGRSLVKIIPFGRPLTPLDLEELRRELEARPEEDRPITMVCLGVELAAQTCVDEWNAMRHGADAVNKMRIIELRTDPKYGGFLKYEPAKAKVRARRCGDRIEVEVVDFISPSIVQRLQQQADILAPRIDDWRAMVDCVMIDPAYDGTVFNVALSDIPERKTDFVEGRYVLLAPAGKIVVAVKIIDMLGEEVVEVYTV